MTYAYKIYVPKYSQGRLQISITSPSLSNSATINLISSDILSAGINVGSFMYEYALGNKYHWSYSSSLVGSTYHDIAYIDLGVVTNTGTMSKFSFTFCLCFIL